ncbi:MAG TPA: hypothetical protein VIY27_08840 [Myxococcota bacterium]
MHPIDPSPPAACARIRAALDAHAVGAPLAKPLGPLLHALAASKGSGTILCLGSNAGEAGAWILDGMSLSSGLVILVREPHEKAAVERELARDIRVSVHQQDAEEFLRDVHAHRFDLIAHLDAGEAPTVAQLALGLLRSGGFYVAGPTGEALDALLADFAADAYSIAPLAGAADAVLVTRRQQPRRPRRRSR